MTLHLHQALIVEDEPEMAADLVKILKACGCEAEIATNRQDALALLTSSTFCLILLDLEIGSEPGSIRGRVENGRAVLEEARRRFPERIGTHAALPIIVISAHATETDAAVAAMRDGASDVVQKLWEAKKKAERIYAALENSGRTSHARCQELLRAAAPASHIDGLVLAIPADRDGRRALVTLSERVAPLPMASLKLLLQLVEARLSTGDGRVHKLDLGGRSDRGLKAISDLRNDLKPAFAGDTKLLIANDQAGNYWLAESVAIGEVNAERLSAFGDSRIAELAAKICNLLAAKEKFSRKA